uniref:Gamma-aminobutyric acid receptor subunit pi n=1 Tax=Cyprinus carpio TaxID=7962 RepID=A0A8C2I0G7_CYPCA
MDGSVTSTEEILPPTIQKLMKGYNKYLRPFFGNGPVTVGMSLDIASIDTISEINMDYTATIFLRQRWTDERLCFDGNKSLSLDGRLVELLWVPDTFIVDSKKSFLHDITVENRLIRIFPNGTVLYALRITTTVACSMDLTKYPMDRQTCTLQLESWGYNVKDVVFHWTRGNQSVSGLDHLQLAQYTLEDHYTSESEAVYETGNYPKLIFHFKLKRSILYFILETYVPSSALVVLSWVSFWISQSSVPARICIGRNIKQSLVTCDNTSSVFSFIAATRSRTGNGQYQQYQQRRENRESSKQARFGRQAAKVREGYQTGSATEKQTRAVTLRNDRHSKSRL